MKVKALKPFETCIDKTTGRPRHEGEVFEADKERADQLLGLGLVEVVEEIRTETLEKKVKKTIR